ncbi:hypothetical protein Taro_027440 [Colocasia esculenta]|uniref:Uncharacterized protein n=1 Tax=Colocasia esculenta TaxID=4460 RepID=A0A843V8Q8_COLES|nr:hypothetical protein [Colocasia esculenta]
MHAAAADQAGNGGLEGGIRGKLLGFRRYLRFYRSLFAFLRLACRSRVTKTSYSLHVYRDL